MGERKSSINTASVKFTRLDEEVLDLPTTEVSIDPLDERWTELEEKKAQFDEIEKSVKKDFKDLFHADCINIDDIKIDHIKTQITIKTIELAILSQQEENKTQQILPTVNFSKINKENNLLGKMLAGVIMTFSILSLPSILIAGITGIVVLAAASAVVALALGAKRLKNTYDLSQSSNVVGQYIGDSSSIVKQS